MPGTVNALAWVGSEEPFGVPARNAVRYLHPGSYVSYAIVAPAGGTYALTLVTDAGTVGSRTLLVSNANSILSPHSGQAVTLLIVDPNSFVRRSSSAPSRSRPPTGATG